MASEKANAELDQLAFELYKSSVANLPTNANGEQAVVSSYRKAETFIAMRERVRSGEFNAATEKQRLADCSAPNLHKSHPFNLVSQRFGSLEQVLKINKWLDEHPTPESEPEQLLPQIHRAFPQLNWDMPAVTAARTIFPAYCGN